MVTHALAERRYLVASMLAGLLPHCKVAMLRTKVLPAIITLSNDADMYVLLSEYSAQCGSRCGSTGNGISTPCKVFVNMVQLVHHPFGD